MVDGGTALDLQDDVALSGPGRVGVDLRSARERLGWTTAQMAQGLRIRLPYIEALEAGRVGDLPGDAYATGFLRTYSGALGLDPNEMVRRMRAGMTEQPRRQNLVFPAPVPERGVPAGAIVLLSVVLAVGAYIGWYRLSGDGRLPAETVTPVPERLASLAEQAIPAPKVAEVPVAPASVPPVAAPNSPVPSVPPAAVPPSVAPSGVAPPAMAQPGSATAMPGQAAPVANPDGGRIVVRATGDAWIGVRDKAGGSVANKILHAGETYAVPGKGTLVLSLGNAANTEFLVDGTAAPPLRANAGLVRRDLPLDADTIRDGKWPGQGDTPMPKSIFKAAPKPDATDAAPKTDQ